MTFPAFFDQVPTITVFDPLARFLGAGGGTFTHRYAEAVKLAGHSCPTVAGTWLMLRAGLARLWVDETPVRGAIEVHFPDQAEDGTTGVTAAVASLVTGARGEDGFKGIAGRFDRRGRLYFGSPVPGALGLRRIDTGAGVALKFDSATVPAKPEMQGLLARWVRGQADAEQERWLGELWQDRVRTILTEHADDPAMVGIAAWDEAPTLLASNQAPLSR